MKKISVLIILLFTVFIVYGCKSTIKTTNTSSTQVAVKPNLKQYRVDMAERIKSAQSTEVDSISGATDSSIGWKQAVAMALLKAESTTTPGTYIDGTYTGVGTQRAYGYEDATVTITNGKIANIILRRLNKDGTEVNYDEWTGKK